MRPLFFLLLGLAVLAVAVLSVIAFFPFYRFHTPVLGEIRDMPNVNPTEDPMDPVTGALILIAANLCVISVVLLVLRKHLRHHRPRKHTLVQLEERVLPRRARS